jgi:hypothetical protein
MYGQETLMLLKHYLELGLAMTLAKNEKPGDA